jgi:hypothetical protein
MNLQKIHTLMELLRMTEEGENGRRINTIIGAERKLIIAEIIKELQKPELINEPA